MGHRLGIGILKFLSNSGAWPSLRTTKRVGASQTMVLRAAAWGCPGSLSITTLIHYLWALTAPWPVSLLPTLHFTQKQADRFINFSQIITITLSALQNIQMAFRENANRHCELWPLSAKIWSFSSLPLPQPQELTSLWASILPLFST